MDDEIREILEDYSCIPRIKKLGDYITNLQQENERLETNCGELQNAIDNIAELVDVPKGMSIEDVYDKVKDYKSRVEKAVEYVNTNLTLVSILDGKKFYGLNDYKFSYQDLLNILQNGSDDNE